MLDILRIGYTAGRWHILWHYTGWPEKKYPTFKWNLSRNLTKKFN